MELLLKLADNFLTLLDAFSVYILVGLFIAGILKQIIPDDFVSSHLGKDSTTSVVKATLFGIPLPVCSCSVIPLAQGLRKEGASKGAVQSFLISTPITGVDSILATFSFFGFVFTAFRVISSIIIAISVGLIQNFFENKNDEKASETKTENTKISSCGCSSNDSKKEPFSLIKAFKYGYGTLFSGMAKSILIGLALGAIFVTFMPEEYSKILFENKLLTYFVVLLFAMPLYTCAVASLPIGAALMLQGMSPGAVFIFLTAGPATSAVTMSVVYNLLGKKSLILYSVTIAILSLIFGWGYDQFFGDLSILNFANEHESTSLFNSIASLLMLLLIVYHIVQERRGKSSGSCCSSSDNQSASYCSSNEVSSTSSCCSTQKTTAFQRKAPKQNSSFSLKP